MGNIAINRSGWGMGRDIEDQPLMRTGFRVESSVRKAGTSLS